jgi:FtsP/CotA-like multicopper oxidase with cupredoxin domain/peroxiredoxin
MKPTPVRIMLAAVVMSVLDVTLAGQVPPPQADKAKTEARRQANTRLSAAWKAFLADRPKAVASANAAVAKDQLEEQLVPPRRRSLALKAQFPTPEPVEIRADRNGVLRTVLAVRYADHTIGSDQVRLRGYNGRLVGPTLRVRPGDTLRITLDNQLPPDSPGDDGMNTFHGPNTTNLHYHGLHVSPAGNSDNVMLQHNGGQRFEYEVTVPEDHPAGTFWYHAHKHGSVALQVGSGMAGALIVEGGMDRLPAIEAMTERVLQQIPYVVPPGETVGVVEPEFADQMFGPGDWQRLGRFTTINGRVQPVFYMRPGEIQRWRTVMTGIRESVTLQLVPADGGGPPVSLHEIAADGLPLGRRETKPQVQLWPGYRSDLLVQAPAAGEYLLVDAASPPGQSVNGLPEPVKYLAKVVVGGPPTAMAMPADADLARFRPVPLLTKDVVGKQSAVYSIANGSFQIDGRSYDPAQARRLHLGAVDQWTVKSADFPHVFHIHVNPFEVVSVKDADGRETLPRPVWRDTIVLLPGQTVTFNTKYRRYIGEFVQHCHILDHEDLGMMEQIAIDPPGGLMNHGAAPGMQPGLGKLPAMAPRWALPDPEGKSVTLNQFAGKKVILVFYRGLGCTHCRSQLDSLARRHRDFAAAGATVVAIGPESSGDVKAVLAGLPADKPLPFVFLSDGDLAAFKAYGCFDGGPTHGVFVLDAAGEVRWQNTGPKPYTDVDRLLKEVQR